jgi:hypothetical protein
MKCLKCGSDNICLIEIKNSTSVFSIKDLELTTIEYAENKYELNVYCKSCLKKYDIKEHLKNNIIGIPFGKVVFLYYLCTT